MESENADRKRGFSPASGDGSGVPASSVTVRRLMLGAIYIALVVGGSVAGHALFKDAALTPHPMAGTGVLMMIATTTMIYTAASAIPFIPGAEIGFGLIFMFGGKIAALVYAAMLAALTLSFLAGRLIPPSACAAALDFAGLHRARDLVLKLAPLPPDRKLDFLMRLAPTRIVPFLLKHRYLAVMALINIPGNSLIGGGGGIAFTAGMSGLFTFPRYFAAIAIAIAPLPVFFTLTM
jgi:hypothetical protein